MKKTSSELRIIGGTHRSRKIIFNEEAGLRPTHNRIRETLFNWLTPVIENSICLDVFAGSGALGFEALSRKAKKVVFLDISKNVIRQLKQNADALKTENAEFYECDFILENKVKNEKFDVVFLDPPFQKKILIAACNLLESRSLLNQDAQIYLEYEKNSVDLNQLPQNWVIKKQGKTSTIDYILCEKK